jgi:hypothetical protein
MPAFDHRRLSLVLLDYLSRATNSGGHFRRPLAFTSSQETPLITLIDNIYFFPVMWRKFTVESCRIQKPIESNTHLLAQFDELVETTISPVLLPDLSGCTLSIEISRSWYDLVSPYYEEDGRVFLDDMSAVSSVI